MEHMGMVNHWQLNSLLWKNWTIEIDTVDLPIETCDYPELCKRLSEGKLNHWNSMGHLYHS